MTDKDKLQQISLSLEKFQRTGDAEHLEDIERVLEYDGIAALTKVGIGFTKLKNKIIGVEKNGNTL